MQNLFERKKDFNSAVMAYKALVHDLDAGRIPSDYYTPKEIAHAFQTALDLYERNYSDFKG